MGNKVNINLVLQCIAGLSLLIGVSLTDWGGSLFAAFLQLVVITIISIVVLMVGTFIIPLIFGIKIESNTATGVNENSRFEFNDTDWEEDADERRERRKAMRRIKKLQRDYPDMWELLVEPEDEYLCFDYIHEKKEEKEQEQSAGFAAVLTTLNGNNAANGNSSS